MQIVPLTPVASQTFTVQLNAQNCVINLYQKSTGLFIDLTADGNVIVDTMLCLNAVGIVRELYLGFDGQLVFIDTQGNNDPDYTGLGSRYILTYWTA